MGDLIVLGIFAYCAAVVIRRTFVDIVVDRFLRALPQ
jgi:hypothetical protein